MWCVSVMSPEPSSVKLTLMSSKLVTSSKSLTSSYDRVPFSFSRQSGGQNSGVTSFKRDRVDRGPVEESKASIVDGGKAKGACNPWLQHHPDVRCLLNVLLFSCSYYVTALMYYCLLIS